MSIALAHQQTHLRHMWLQLFGKVRHKTTLGICVAKQNHVAIHFARVEYIVVLSLAGDHKRATGFDCQCQQTGA
jgi:hypothetical protein